MRPFAIAGDANTGSATELVRNTSCAGPALITNVSPSSLVRKTRSSNATADAVNVAGTGTRPPSYMRSPVTASRHVSRPVSVIRYRYWPQRIGDGTYAVPLL